MVKRLIAGIGLYTFWSLVVLFITWTNLANVCGKTKTDIARFHNKFNTNSSSIFCAINLQYDKFNRLGNKLKKIAISAILIMHLMKFWKKKKLTEQSALCNYCPTNNSIGNGCYIHCMSLKINVVLKRKSRRILYKIQLFQLAW